MTDVFDLYRSGDLEEFKKWFKPEDIDKLNEYGWRLIHCKQDNNELFEYVLSMTKDVNVKCGNPFFYGWTPLHFACYYNNIQRVKLLLDHGADVNIKTNDWANFTSLDICLDYLTSQYKIIKLLVMHGANPSKKLFKTTNHEYYQKLVNGSRVMIVLVANTILPKDLLRELVQLL